MRRPSSMLTVWAVCLTLGSLSSLASAADKGNPDGRWKFTIVTQNGDFALSLWLKAEGEKLTGAVSREDQTTDISDGSFKKDTISFQVIGEHDGQKLVSHYRGRLDGDSIKGTIQVDFDGNAFEFDWDAKREKK